MDRVMRELCSISRLTESLLQSVKNRETSRYSLNKIKLRELLKLMVNAGRTPVKVFFNPNVKLFFSCRKSSNSAGVFQSLSNFDWGCDKVEDYEV